VAEAVADALAEAGRSGLGLRRYAPGCVALALRGPVDDAARDHLKGLIGELPRAAYRELVLDLAGVDGCDTALARTLGRLRIRCVLRGARVEVHDPPEALTAELGIPGPDRQPARPQGGDRR
jgi:anti-anti-sigma regulatory factor